MAYFLRFDGSNDRVTLASGVTMADGISIDIDFEYGGDNGDILSGFISNNPGRWALLITGGGNLAFFSGTSGITTGTATLVAGTRYTVNLSYSGGVASVSLDENPDITATPSTLLPLTQIDNGILTMDLYGLSIGVGGSVNHNYDPSASNGTGSILPDIVGGNNGTLVNFPTDDSQWVFYSDATGVTADVAYTVNTPSVSASASATVPAPQADVAFTVSAPSVSTSATASLPQPVSDIAFTVNTPSVTASASATLPGYSATVSFTVSSPSVSANSSATLPNPSADVSYTISPPSIGASVSATLPNPVSDIAFSVSAPGVSVSAAATEPNFSANVAFTVSSPSVSISASATLPQPESTVSFAVSPPSVSVVAIVGGIAIIVDEETNINQRVLSNNINAPILSNNING